MSKSSKRAHILGLTFTDSDKDQEKIRQYSRSLFRFTYRRDFSPLVPYSITSDAGWGCMLRSAQSIMANAMKIHILGNDWRAPSLSNQLRKNEKYCEILKWFTDYPGLPHFYSLHHLVQSGMKYDKLPGEWFGPSTAALVLRDLAKLHRRKYGGPIEVLVTQGNVIYMSEVEKICMNEVSIDQIKKDNKIETKIDRKIDSKIHSTMDSDMNIDGNIDIQIQLDKDLEGIIYNKCEERKDIEDDTIINSNRYSCLDNSNNNNNNNNVNSKDSNKDIEIDNKIENMIENKINSDFFDPLYRPPPNQIADWKTSLVVFIPIMLGIGSVVSNQYIESLKEVLNNKYCIGVLGGRPNHAIYFIGYKDNHLLGLDPHTVYSNPSLTEPFPSSQYISEIQIDEFEVLDFSRLDPSIAIGFYFRDRQEFHDFCSSSDGNFKLDNIIIEKNFKNLNIDKLNENKMNKKKQEKKKNLISLYSIQRNEPSHFNSSFDDDNEDDDDDDDDEYVLV